MRCRTSPLFGHVHLVTGFVTRVSCGEQEEVLYEKVVQGLRLVCGFLKKRVVMRLVFSPCPGDDMGTTCAVRSWQRPRTLVLICRETLGLSSKYSSSKIKVLSSALVIQQSSSCINYPMVICTFLAMKTKPQLALS